MARESTGNDILDELYRQHDKLKEQFIQVGQELGYCDESGSFETLIRDEENGLTELEKKRLENKEDLEKEFQITFLSLEMAKISYRIREMEANMKKTNE